MIEPGDTVQLRNGLVGVICWINEPRTGLTYRQAVVAVGIQTWAAPLDGLTLIAGSS